LLKFQLYLDLPWFEKYGNLMEFERDTEKSAWNSSKHGGSLPEEDELRSEYDPAELKGGVRGKYLEQYRGGTNLALLAPDVRAAFPTDETVNQALRSLMHGSMPPH
jgi:hypothetical protein